MPILRSKEYRMNSFEDEITVECKVCEEELYLDPYMDLGDTVYCEQCDSEFVIVSTAPIVLRLVDEEDSYEFDDDWD